MQTFYNTKQVRIPDYVNQVEYIMTCLNMNEDNCKLLAESSPPDKTAFYNFQSVSAVKQACLDAGDALQTEQVEGTTS